MAERKINLKRIAHVYYTHANLEKAHEFLLDFGLSVTQQSADEIYYRGYGTETFVYCGRRGAEDTFGGAAFVVDSMEDLELATKKIPEASKIYKSNAPGGGKCVTFHDPIAGREWPWHLVYSQTPVEMTDIPGAGLQLPNFEAPSCWKDAAVQERASSSAQIRTLWLLCD